MEWDPNLSLRVPGLLLSGVFFALQNRSPLSSTLLPALLCSHLVFESTNQSVNPFTVHEFQHVHGTVFV